MPFQHQSSPRHRIDLKGFPHKPRDIMSSAVQFGSLPQDVPAATPEGVFLVHNRTSLSRPNFFDLNQNKIKTSTDNRSILSFVWTQLGGHRYYHGLTSVTSPSGPFPRSSSALDPSACRTRIPTRSGSESYLSHSTRTDLSLLLKT